MRSASPVPGLGASPRVTDFLVGASLPFRAFKLLWTSPRLFRLGLVCAALTLITLLGLVVLLALYTEAVVSAFISMPGSPYGKAAWYLAVAITFVVLLVVGGNTVPLLLLAPLQDPLSEATEALCGAPAPGPSSLGGLIRGAALSVGHAFKRILLLLGGYLLLLPLNLVPVAGPGLWSLLSLSWTVLWLAAEYLDAPMARHLYGFRVVLQGLRGRLAACLGFGAAVQVLFFVPILNLFFIPVATVAGTLLYRALLEAGAVPPPPDR